MKVKSGYYELTDLRYEDASLTIRIVELVQGEPDGVIGVPFIVGPDSRRYSVSFKGVTEFRQKAEPCYVNENERAILSAFMWEYVSSDYVAEACPFGSGANDPVRHFCVYTESVVVDVLSSREPVMEMVRCQNG